MDNDKNLALEEALKTAATEARALAMDAHHGKSPVAAGLRSVIDHAVELLAVHRQWMAQQTLGPGDK